MTILRRFNRGEDNGSVVLIKGEGGNARLMIKPGDDEPQYASSVNNLLGDIGAPPISVPFSNTGDASFKQQSPGSGSVPKILQSPMSSTASKPATTVPASSTVSKPAATVPASSTAPKPVPAAA